MDGAGADSLEATEGSELGAVAVVGLVALSLGLATAGYYMYKQRGANADGHSIEEAAADASAKPKRRRTTIEHKVRLSSVIGGPRALVAPRVPLAEVEPLNDAQASCAKAEAEESFVELELEQTK